MFPNHHQTCPLWARLSFVLLFTSFGCGLWAQKIDIDRKSITTQLLSLPSKDVDTSWQTFAYVFNGGQNLSPWSIDKDEVKNTYFKLDGYTPVENDADLNLEATLQPVRILDFNVQSRVEKTKDKSGRETSTTYYKYVLSYESGFSWKMKNKAGKEISEKYFTLSPTNIQKKEGTEYRTYKEASDSYTTNRAQINRDIATSEIKGHLLSMYQNINKQYGYKPGAERFNIWVLDTKKHPEYEAQQKYAEEVKMAFAAISHTGLTNADMEALKPAMDYYLSIPGKYTSDEKADAKLRYAAYFNLSNMCLHLDDLAKAIEYANLLIKNDYDKGDGKDFLKDAEKLSELFSKKKVTSRRFARIKGA